MGRIYQEVIHLNLEHPDFEGVIGYFVDGGS